MFDLLLIPNSLSRTYPTPLSERKTRNHGNEGAIDDKTPNVPFIVNEHNNTNRLPCHYREDKKQISFYTHLHPYKHLMK